MRAFLFLLLFVVKAFSLTLQDYLVMRGFTQVELVDNFTFGKWRVYILKSGSSFKTVAIKDETVKEFWSIPAITDENYLKIQNFKLYPDGTVKKIEDGYPQILKEKRIGKARFVLKKYSSGGIPKLYVQTSNIEKEIVEFHDTDFFMGDKYAYMFDIDNEYFRIYRLFPSEYLYDLEEIFKQKVGFGYTYEHLYCDGNVLVYFYNAYEPRGIYGLLFDIKNEEVKKIFHTVNWDIRKIKIIGCVNRKIYVKENFKLRVYSFDLRPAKPVVVRLKEKGIKLSKTAFTLKGCVKAIKTEDYVVLNSEKENFSDIYIFDKNFSQLKSMSFNESTDLYFVDNKIYRFSLISSCLFQIYPFQKQIKCSKIPHEEIIPADNGILIFYKPAMITPFHRVKGYVKIEKEGKAVWEKHYSTKDKLWFLFTQKGIFVDDRKNDRLYFVDLKGNEKLLDKKLKLISSSLTGTYFDYRNMIFSDENYYYRFDFEEKEFKPIMKNYFMNEYGNKQFCELSQNIVSCHNNIYSLKDAKKVAYLKDIGFTRFICFTDKYILGKEKKNDRAILKFFEKGKLVDEMPIKKFSEIICLENGFLVIKRKGRWSHKCTSHVEYYRFKK